MLVMKIVTKIPGKKAELRRKRIAAGIPKYPGAKLLGEWSAIQADRTFVLLDVTDPIDLARLVEPYSDLVYDEIIPVIETEEMLREFPA